MKPLTSTQAMTMINKMIEHFIALTGEYLQQALNSKSIPLISKKAEVIENVGFADIIALYKHLSEHKKMLCLPGEIGNENITIIYTPAPGFTIAIESEPCVDLRCKIYNNNLNWN